MNPYRSGLPIVFLKPGEIFIGDNPAVVTTILGSCVSIVLYNRRLKLGAICHALLPSGSDEVDTLKYVDRSFRKMLEAFLFYGIQRDEIEVKLFGGSDVIRVGGIGSRPTVGRQNIEAAVSLIRQEGLKLTSSSVGGARGRKLFYFTHTGEVFLKHQKQFGAPDEGPDTLQPAAAG